MNVLRSVCAAMIAVLGVLSFPLLGEDQTPGKEITVRGRLVSLDEWGQARSLEAMEVFPERRFGLRSNDGTIYPFLPSDPKTAMFTDPRVQRRELQVAGWVRAGYLEVIRVHSIREGRLYDLFYRCEVCNITSYEPGPCWCCQDEFEFREPPAGEGHH